MPATGFMAEIASTLIGRRNWARLLSAPLAWFLEAMRERTSRIWVSSTPYLWP